MTQLLILILTFSSFGNYDTSSQEVSIIGIWQLKQEYSNEGGNTALKEFPLSTCDKETTLEILDNGKFIVKSYYQNSNVVGECSQNNEDIKGNWKSTPERTFCFIYDKNTNLGITESQVTTQKENLIITLIYDDEDLGPKTTHRFVYSKVQYYDK